MVISYIDISLQMISYSSQAAYNCYLLPNGVTEQTRWHASGMTSSLPKPPFRRKNLTDISYTDRVIANCPKFCCQGNGGRWAKMRLAAFNGPSPKIPLQTQKFRRYLLHKPSYNQFCPKFCCHGNGGQSGKNAVGSIRWHIPENPL